jgi:hypothetical protein
MSFVILDAASHPVSATWGGQSVPDYALLKSLGRCSSGPLIPQRSAHDGLAALRNTMTPIAASPPPTLRLCFRAQS